MGSRVVKAAIPSGWRYVQAGLVFACLMVLSPSAIGVVKKKAPLSAKAKRTGSAKAKAKPVGSKNIPGHVGKKPGAVDHRASVPKSVVNPQSVRLASAFSASSQLRPMAQQLASSRSAAAYDGVLSYARSHPGDGAATAYMALGHAYMLDKRYPEAASTYRMAGGSNDALSDYADYLGGQAALAAGHGDEAYALLDHFAERHPDSIFVANAPVLLANLYLQQNNASAAVNVLTPLAGTAQAAHSDFRYALARAYQMSGDAGRAAPLFRQIFLAQALSTEAAQSRNQLVAMGVPLTSGERKMHADALYNAKHYSEASVEYHALEKSDPGLSQADRDALQIYAAVCDLKLKRLGRRDVEKLPETDDDSAALKLYLLSELARNENSTGENDRQVAEIVKRFPHSRWTEEALYSGGNMHLLKHEQAEAVSDYESLVRLFPASTYAPSAHWRAAWMSYRMRHMADAARLMDEQITLYPAGIEAAERAVLAGADL